MTWQCVNIETSTSINSLSGPGFISRKCVSGANLICFDNPFKSQHQASGTGAYHGTSHSYLGTRLPVTGHFLERKDGGRIVSSLSDASQQFEEKYSEPSHKETNSAIFSTSAVISSKPDPSRQDQPLLTLFHLGFFAKIAKFLFWELVDDRRLKLVLPPYHPDQ